LSVEKKARDAGKTTSATLESDSQAALYASVQSFFGTLQTSINIAKPGSDRLLAIPLAQEKNVMIAKRPIANAAWRFNSASAENH